MTPERLAEIRRRVEAAPAGPWLNRDGGYKVTRDPCGLGHTDHHAWAVVAYPVGHAPRPFDEKDAIAAFIAHARQDIPDLLAEIERLQGLSTQ